MPPQGGGMEITMAKIKTDKKMEYLFKGILSLNSVEECKAFFDDICTVTELIDMSNRLTAAKMLSDDKTYSEVIEKTGLSTATISRVNRCLKYGSDGYLLVLDNLNKLGEAPIDKEKEDNKENK